MAAPDDKGGDKKGGVQHRKARPEHDPDPGQDLSRRHRHRGTGNSERYDRSADDEAGRPAPIGDGLGEVLFAGSRLPERRQNRRSPPPHFGAQNSDARKSELLEPVREHRRLPLQSRVDKECPVIALESQPHVPGWPF